MLESMTAAGNVKLIYIWAGEVKMGKCIGGTSHITEKTPMGKAYRQADVNLEESGLGARRLGPY